MPSAPRPLRLLIAGINWPPETFITRLIEGLIQAGVPVTLACRVKPIDLEDQVKWLPTPSWDASVPARLARLAGMAIRAKACAARDVKVFRPFIRCSRNLSQRLQVWNQLLPYAGRRWDIIYFPWNSAAIDHLPVFDLRSPVIVSCRGAQVSVAPHNPERAEILGGLRDTFHRAAAVHCVSEATLRDACQFGLDPAKARVIRPAVDPEVFRPGPSCSDHNGIFRLVTTGSLIWRKGMEYALSSIRKLRDRGVRVRFEIIGDGPERQRVLYTTHDLGLQDCVRLHGRLRPEEVLQRLQQADAFLLSSLSEGISNAVLEAMACGLPVVTTDCGGMREAVTDGVEGFVVPVRDAEAMAAALLRLAVDVGLRQRIGAAARARIVREFSLNRQIAQWLELFRSVLNRDERSDALSHGAQPEDCRRAEVAPAESLVRAAASNLRQNDKLSTL